MSKSITAVFEEAYRIIRHPTFLERKGLGNEVPFFIQPYDIADQKQVYNEIDALGKRLTTEGAPAAMIPLYDIVLQVLKETDRPERNGRFFRR